MNRKHFIVRERQPISRAESKLVIIEVTDGVSDYTYRTRRKMNVIQIYLDMLKRWQGN